MIRPRLGLFKNDYTIEGSVTELTTSQLEANAYLQALPREARRDEGQVYTSMSLVEFILELGGFTPDLPIETLTVLDPACGGGVFLLGSLARLADRLARSGRDPRTTEGSRDLYSVVEAHLFGVDKDPVACELSRRAVRRRIEKITGRPAARGFFESNIVNDDFLLPAQDALPRRSFDLVVGNPPYVATTRLSEDQKRELRSRFIVANGRLDLYSMFFERGLRLLERGGRLAFITPNKFLVSQSSRWLRKLLVNGAAVDTIANFRSHRVFEGAATVPCITVLQRGAPGTSCRLLECAVEPGGRGPVVVTSEAKARHPQGGGEAWVPVEPELLSIARLLQARHPTLGDLSTRISAGIATGRDRIFVLPAGSELDLEPELRRPTLRGQDLSAFQIQAPGLELILPYLPVSAGRPELVDLRDFPKTRSYLEAQRTELETRHCVRKWGKAWFDVHDPWTLDITGMTKILVPDVASGNRFAMDEGKYCPLHSAYYVLPKGIDPSYLTAVLNSTPVEFLVRLFAPVVKDGFSRYRRQFLITLPIPEAGPHRRREIVAAAEAGDYPKANSLCCALFGLSSEPHRVIQGFLAGARRVHRIPRPPSVVGKCP